MSYEERDFEAVLQQVGVSSNILEKINPSLWIGVIL